MQLLPKWIREKGIITQQELIMALLPYMEWHSRTDLKDSFEKIIPHTRGKRGENNALKSGIHRLRKKGLIEMKEGEIPVCNVDGWEPPRYSHYMRIAKSVPREKHTGRQAMTDGSSGLKAKAPRPAPRITTKLSMDDLRYIQCNRLGMSARALHQMFKISIPLVFRIRKGYVPPYLRS